MVLSFISENRYDILVHDDSSLWYCPDYLYTLVSGSKKNTGKTIPIFYRCDSAVYSLVCHKILFSALVLDRTAGQYLTGFPLSFLSSDLLVLVWAGVEINCIISPPTSFIFLLVLAEATYINLGTPAYLLGFSYSGYATVVETLAILPVVQKNLNGEKKLKNNSKDNEAQRQLVEKNSRE